MVIESCRRLVGDELTAYHSARARAAYGKRHLLPCMQAMRPKIHRFIHASMYQFSHMYERLTDCLTA